jgi:hypothetical protein
MVIELTLGYDPDTATILPSNRTHKREARAPSRQSTTPAQVRTVTVRASFLRLVKTILSGHGFHVLIAADGPRELAAARDH